MHVIKDGNTLVLFGNGEFECGRLNVPNMSANECREPRVKLPAGKRSSRYPHLIGNDLIAQIVGRNEDGGTLSPTE